MAGTGSGIGGRNREDGLHNYKMRCSASRLVSSLMPYTLLEEGRAGGLGRGRGGELCGGAGAAAGSRLICQQHFLFNYLYFGIFSRQRTIQRLCKLLLTHTHIYTHSYITYMCACVCAGGVICIHQTLMPLVDCQQYLFMRLSRSHRLF